VNQSDGTQPIVTGEYAYIGETSPVNDAETKRLADLSDEDDDMSQRWESAQSQIHVDPSSASAGICSTQPARGP
jgi:hypothetical protein